MATKELTDLALEFAGTLSRHDPRRCGAIIGADYVNHNPYVAQTAGPGFSGRVLHRLARGVSRRRGDLRRRVRRLGHLRNGTVVGRFTYVGTFTEPIMGIQPTGKRVVMRSIDIWRVRDGELRRALGRAEHRRLVRPTPRRRTPTPDRRSRLTARGRADRAVDDASHPTEELTMNAITTVAAFIGILTAAIGYGTDVFEALVQRPALAHVDDAAVAAVMGRVHEYGDRRLPIPGTLAIVATATATAAAALGGSTGRAAAAGVALVALLVWSAHLLSASPRRSTASSSPPHAPHVTPDEHPQPPTRWDSVITARALLMTAAVAGTCAHRHLALSRRPRKSVEPCVVATRATPCTERLVERRRTERTQDRRRGVCVAPSGPSRTGGHCRHCVRRLVACGFDDLRILHPCSVLWRGAAGFVPGHEFASALGFAFTEGVPAVALAVVVHALARAAPSTGDRRLVRVVSVCGMSAAVVSVVECCSDWNSRRVWSRIVGAQPQQCSRLSLASMA